jgi:indolepyruvate ferredoxin oxidoreductase
MVVSSSKDALAKLSPEHSTAVLNLDEIPTAAQVLHRDAPFPAPVMVKAVINRSARNFTLHTGALSQALFGDTVTANTMLLGFAWQKGLIPLSADALTRAIELNGVAVNTNKRAFNWGRALAHDQADVENLAGVTFDPHPPQAGEGDYAKHGGGGVDALIARRVADLTAYHDAAYAERYLRLVDTARTAERALDPHPPKAVDPHPPKAGEGDRPKAGGGGTTPRAEPFTEAVARYAYKLMAYKDEYEVARLYTDGTFDRELRAQVAKAERVSLWLAPPIFSKVDPATGRPKKRKYGQTMLSMMRLLAKLKFLRGTRFDPFGNTEERKEERRLIEKYETLIRDLAQRMTPASKDAAVALARFPDDVRGYGPIKMDAIARTEAKKLKLLKDFESALQRPTVEAAE